MTLDKYKIISSFDNNQIKLLEKLKLKKYREKLQKFSVENLTIIYDALKDNSDFEALFITSEFAAKHINELKFLESNSQSKNFYLLDYKLNKHYSGLETPPGIMAVYNIKNKNLDKSSVIYLNGINDPGNMGTILRSALAFNFVNIVLDKNCVDIYNQKTINAAKDAIFKLNIIKDEKGNWLDKNKLPIYITSSHSELILDKFKPAKEFCLVLGNESHGVDKKITKLAKANLKIEISSKIESLNVAVAASILFYELKQKIN